MRAAPALRASAAALHNGPYMAEFFDRVPPFVFQTEVLPPENMAGSTLVCSSRSRGAQR